VTTRIAIPRHDEQDAIRTALLWYRDPFLQVADANPLPWLWLVAQEAWLGKAWGPVLIEAGRFEASWPRKHRKVGMYLSEPREATFSMIRDHGCWIRTAAEHVAFTRRAMAALRTVKHVATMDWMCEPVMIARTGLSVIEHQRRTIESFIRLRHMAPEVPWLPTLQGHTIDDYLRCIDMFEAAGVDLEAEPLIGLGSVCRRSGTLELVAVIAAILRYRPGLRLHGFGVKSTGTLLSCLDLRSVDSEAWSTRGRYTERDLRSAVGLPPTAKWAELRAAMEDQGVAVDLDLLDIYEWKRDHGEEAAIQNSIEWAEGWRARQQMRIAAAVMERSFGLARELMPGQRSLWPGL
jgi:hypothetical protein